MFSAHLVFGDINDHSSLPIDQRVPQLERFWQICERHRPSGIQQSRLSFYDVDNDSIMAGFAALPGMIRGEEVLNWVLFLQSELLTKQIAASFAVNLIAGRQQIDWSTCKGFVNDPQRLYIPDDILETHGRVLRSRLVGDALIATSRLLELAKKVPFPVVFTTFQGGNLSSPPSQLFPDRQHPALQVQDASSHFPMLGSQKAEWLTTRKVKAFAVIDSH